MRYIKVRNWDKYQHYRNRSPSWIKVYRDLRSNYEWCQLSDAARGHLVGIWLLATERDNKIPADPAWIGQQISAQTKVDLDSMITLGFLDYLPDSRGDCRPASNMLADCYQPASNMLDQSRVEESRVEEIRSLCSDLHGVGEGDGETLCESSPESSPESGPEPDTEVWPTPTPHPDPDGFAEFWESYPGNRKRDKGKCRRWWAKHVTDPEPVIDGLDAWCRSDEWQSDGGKYVPAPYVWLSNERWESPPQPRRVLGCTRGEEVPF